MRSFFVTGIGTEVGKTISSAVLVEKLKCDYWKPVQSGDLDNSDTEKVKGLITNSISVFHSEAYRLRQPFSPHKSAELDSIRINLKNIMPPSTENRLLIEGAGGLMVPLNDEEFVIDLIQQLQTEVILIVRHYLGSINHTLLSLEILHRRSIPLKGIIINGRADEYSERIILKYPGVKLLGRIPELETIDKKAIVEAGNAINELF